MAADTFDNAKDHVHAAATAGADAAAESQKALRDALAAAERTISEAAKSAERVFKEGVEALRAQSRAYTDNAGEHLEDAQRYLSERVRSRPLTATLAGLGVGVLLGLVLSHRER
jgi:ElaB/YqjD/DUF883 family membrane-anchored ribosome-binding protein